MNAPAVVEYLRAAGLSASLVGAAGVTVRPASLLTTDLRMLIRACHGELLDHLRQAKAANERSDSDRDCWPNDPSTGAAMNTTEIALFLRRHARLLALGFTEGEADQLADRLRLRDREGDDRSACAECHFAHAKSCPGGYPLPLTHVHRCAHLVVRLPE
mgnify:FL=1